jgi:hypothetical protein
MEKSSSPRSKRSPTPIEELGRESDILSFWLLLLFIAVFFGIAAEESRRPMFVSAQMANPVAPFSRNDAAREYDLSSVEKNGARGPIGSRTEKFEVPATGK